MSDSKARRVRVRRSTNPEAARAKPARSAVPKWGALDLVRLADVSETTGQAPDMFTVLSVQVDTSAVSKASDPNTYDPGEDHRYRVRSYLTGRETTLVQSMLADVDSKFSRYIVSFYKGHLMKLVSALREHLIDQDEADGGGFYDDRPATGYALDDLRIVDLGDMVGEEDEGDDCDDEVGDMGGLVSTRRRAG